MEGNPLVFCDWLGVDVEGRIDLLSSSFPGGTLHADLLARVTPDRLLHVEYMRNAETDLAVRMIGYRARIMQRHRRTRVTQVVIILGDGSVASCDDPEIGFSLGLQVVYLRDRTPGEFLTAPRLAPLAVLAKGDHASALVESLEIIRDGTTPGPERNALLGSAAALATIRLDRSTINTIGRESGMSIESIVDFYSGTEIGQVAIERGRTHGRTQVLTSVLRERFGEHERLPDLAKALSVRFDEAAAVHQAMHAESLDALIAFVEQGGA